MAHAFDDQLGRVLGFSAEDAIFTRSMRRDLADLNHRYLELGLRAETASDPLFGWSDDVRREIEAACRAVLERMAACPFALFELQLPCASRRPDAEPGAESDRVEDRSHGGGPRVPRAAACIAFSHGALFTAWRLADRSPLAARIAFGLSPAEEMELSEACPTRIALLASHSGVVRARWPDRPRFWVTLRGASQADSGDSLQRAHCFGLCLMDGQRNEARSDGSPVPTGLRRR